MGGVTDVICGDKAESPMIVRITEAGDISLSKPWDTGIDYTVNRIKWRLQFFYGEWFMDTRLGVPYFRDILRKGASAEVVRNVLRKVVQQTPGVARVDSFGVVPGSKPRSMRVTFRATYSDGTSSGAQELLLVV
jgi:hypothetical protein